MSTLAPGLVGRVTTTVSVDDTAVALGSGDVPVLATPRVAALVEAASVAAVGGALGEGQTSVGTKLSLDHDIASPVGAEIVVNSELVEVDGRRLLFYVAAYDADRIVASGRVERVVVDRARFLAKARPGS
ncbi:MAG: thioesterase [Streptosporangiales bacterium]|nr:thioesterase [Streptosporangiales bacterium]